MADVLQQYSSQLNVYSSSNVANRGVLTEGVGGQFEISFKQGASALGDVLIKRLYYQDIPGTTPSSVGASFIALEAKITSEASTRSAADGVLTAAVVTERDRAQAEEKKSSDGLASEVSARTSAVTSVASALAQEVADRIGAVSTLTNSIANEATARGAADGVHTSAIASNASAITAEAKRADDEEKRIVGLVSAEVSARTTAVATVTAAVATEKARAEAAEASLQLSIDSAIGGISESLTNTQDSLQASLGVESARAIAAEDALTVRINNVLSNITPAAIDSFTEVVTALNASGGSLTGALNTEVSARQSADTAIQARLDTIEALLLALQASN